MKACSVTVPRILVGPKDQVHLVQPSERYGLQRRYAVAVRPAYRVLDSGTDLENFKARAYETLSLAAHAFPKLTLNAWRALLDLSLPRKVYRAMRWFPRWLPVAIERDDWRLKAAAIALFGLLVLWIVL